MSKLITLAIDRRRNESVMDQIRQAIKERMLDKTFIQNDYLPDTHELALANQLDEHEVIKAYQLLIKEGYIIKEAKGHKVARFNIEEKAINSLQSVTEMLKNEGFTPSTNVLEKAQVDLHHHPELKEFYDSTHPLLYIKTLYCGDERPLLYLETYVSLKDYPQIVESADLKAFIHQQRISAHRRIDVVKVTPDVAKALHLEMADAVMRVRNVYFGQFKQVLTVSFVHAAPNYSLLLDSQH